jgi:hypothetical protein
VTDGDEAPERLDLLEQFVHLRALPGVLGEPAVAQREERSRSFGVSAPLVRSRA